MTDPTKRPLNFPKWHIPYLEKHRITELFHEIARELLIQKPDDHIVFMKQILQKAAASRDALRVIMIGSMKINRVAIAELISKHTKQLILSVQLLKTIFGVEVEQPKSIAKGLACIIKSQKISSTGWIIADCINNEEDATALVKLGILPTHVLYLVAPFQLTLDSVLYCSVPENWPQLRRNLFALRDLFSKKVREVSLSGKNIAEVAAECLDVCRMKQAIKIVRPRVVLMGPRGSGRKTQAKLLSQSLKIIHVDFEYIICQAWMSDTDLGAELRKCKKRVCFHSELLCQIVNKRILEKDCLDHGWVLTGYPFTVTDLQFLDCLQTPPNRIIAIDSDLGICKGRHNRLINAHTGSTTLLPKLTSQEADSRSTLINDDKLLRRHPKDAPELVQAELDFYCQNYGSIRKYCGDTMMLVNGDQNEKWVHECIVGYVLGANPPGPPRRGFGKDIPEVCDCDCINLPPHVAKTYLLSV